MLGHKVQVKSDEKVKSLKAKQNNNRERLTSSDLKFCRWNALGGGNIVRTPGLQFPDGFHVQMMEKGTGE